LGVNGCTFEDMGSHKAEALLAYLAVESRPQSRNELVTMLWPESSEERVSSSLRVLLSTLRKSVGDYLDISREAVGMESGAPVPLDVADLEARLETGKVEQALEIYPGGFLQGFHIRGECKVRRLASVGTRTTWKPDDRRLSRGDRARN
jgi:two-component SAPR family response regulator